jgi:predicted phage replisome organizer/uncharacterized phage protein (TIGR02220 family)
MGNEVKWIKLTTNMFDDEKIKLIENMPDADSILVIWIKLLVQAGKTNANGYIYLNENVPYTDEMIATIFSRQLNTVRLALKTFQDFGMIEMDDKGIYIENWVEHQNIEGLNKLKKKKEQNRLRQEKYRKKQKLIREGKTGNVMVTLSNGTELELELDSELDSEREKETEEDISNSCPAEKKQDIPYKEIINYLNSKIGSRYKSTTNKTKKLIKARWNEGFRLDDFKTVIDKKCVEWMGDKEMEKYLRPPTLFSNKFESYLNQLSVENEDKGGNDNRNSERNNRNEQQKDYTAGAPEGFFKN